MDALTPLRSLLSVPALNARFLEKAASVPADALVFDLEDSIALARKAAARAWLADALPGFDSGGRPVFVRPNDLATGLLEADLHAIVGPALDGIFLPKVHGPQEIEKVDAYLTFLERTRGLACGALRLIAWIESAAGVAASEAICRASPRLCAVAFGAEDYVTSLGVMRTRAGTEVEFARARIANAALAAGLRAIDCPEPDYRDLEFFEREVTHVRALGYGGKYCIHPAQVEVANRLFRPDGAQLEWARRVVDAYDAGERAGLGAVGLDGVMVDRPIYLRARSLLRQHEVIEGHVPREPAGASASP